MLFMMIWNYRLEKQNCERLDSESRTFGVCADLRGHNGIRDIVGALKTEARFLLD